MVEGSPRALCCYHINPGIVARPPHRRFFEPSYPHYMSQDSSAGTITYPPFAALSLEASLTVGDVTRSRDWYRDVLGFTVDREFERPPGRVLAVTMRAGAIRILLTQDDGAKGENRVKGEGFSLQFTTPQDVDAIATHVKETGAKLDTEPADIWGARVFRLRDLDGFRLVISSQR
jgi:uncharacterized glyoxalase superfamily protein PhnB